MSPASPTKPLVIPIFIPHSGCPHLCAFCNQKLITKTSSPLPDARFIRSEVQRYLKYRGERRRVQLSFYGGTFLGLADHHIRELLDTAGELCHENRIDTIRFSTRPDTVTKKKLALLKGYPVATIELGVQSMDDGVLTLSQRGHDARSTVNAAEMLAHYGYETGMQMMVGLPGDARETAEKTAQAMAALKPDFVRIYPLIVLAGSRVHTWYLKGNYIPLSLDEAVAQVKALYLIFSRKNIPVIRMGLQASDLLLDPEQAVAGPWHPAFGHLVLGELFLDKVLKQLKELRLSATPSHVTIKVHPFSISRCRGDKNRNMKKLKTIYPQVRFTVKGDRSMERDGIYIA